MVGRADGVHEIRHDPVMTIALMVLSAGLSGLVVPSLVAGVASLPVELVAGCAALLLAEGLWRDRLRPRLAWNRVGVVLVHPFSVRTIRWSDIDRVDRRFNEFEFRAGNELVRWESDANVLAGLISPRYRERSARRLSALRAGRANACRHGDLPTSSARRPFALYLAQILVAVTCAAVSSHPGA